jgi:hypothetical protein
MQPRLALGGRRTLGEFGNSVKMTRSAVLIDKFSTSGFRAENRSTCFFRRKAGGRKRPGVQRERGFGGL